MNKQRDSRRTESLAYQIWEEQGRPEGRHEDHWAEAERRLDSDTTIIASNISQTDATTADENAVDAAQDTPGRPKSSSSRQQTQPGQSTQTGSADLDAQNGSSSPTPRR